MTPDQANKALQFMDRVPLRGDEVKAFLEVVTVLTEIARGEHVLPPE